MFEVYNVMTTYVYILQMFTAVRLVNTSTLHKIYHTAVVMVRLLKLHSHSTFRVDNTVVNCVHIRSPELTHLVPGSLYPLTNVSPFPSPQVSANPLSSLLLRVPWF